MGYDFTFSVPKSVSTLYAMSGDQGIMDAFRGAVAETMREIEAEMKTRVRMGGGRDEDRVTGNMASSGVPSTPRPGPLTAFLTRSCTPMSLLSIRLLTMRKAAGRLASSPTSNGIARTSRRHSGFGWRTGFRTSASGGLRKRDDFEIAGDTEGRPGQFLQAHGTDRKGGP